MSALSLASKGRFTMVVSLKKRKELRAEAVEFFSAVRGDLVIGSSKGKRIFDSGFRLRDGVIFIETALTDAARRRVIDRCNKLLGPVDCHETDLDDLLWSVAADGAKASELDHPEKMVDRFLDALTDRVNQESCYIDTNYAVVLEEGVNDLVIGPVRIVALDKLASELRQRNPEAKWAVAVGQPGHCILPNGRMIISLTDVVWCVTLRASKANTREQAAWLIDVAVSLLRLSHKVAGPFFPKVGDQEAHPLRPMPNDGAAIIQIESAMSTGGSRIPSHYRVSAAHLAELQGELEKWGGVFFSPKRGTLAERVSQGLGWMARGRRASDRAERLLFFFTAIEALLSSDDKTAPVTQTIARHASVILAESAGDREAVAIQIKTLYSARSALVHSGERRVTKSDADIVQIITEGLYMEVIKHADMSSSFRAFGDKLARASYGAAWP